MPDQTIKIDLELPKELFIKGRESAQRVKMEALKRLAATFYADGSLSLGKAAELANVSKQEFLDFLAAGFALEDHMFKGLAIGAPYTKAIGMARSALTAAMVGKTITFLSIMISTS